MSVATHTVTRRRVSPKEARDRKALEETWKSLPGFWGWLTTTNHKAIARRYIVTAFIFFLIGVVLALFMRLQLTRPTRALPVMKINPAVTDIFAFRFEDFALEGYDPHPHIKAKVAV